MSERNASRAVKLLIEPFQFISYLQWDSHQTFNDHATLKITGLISEDKRMEYAEMATREVWVCAKAIDEEDEEVILFQGVLTHLRVDSVHQYHTMSIEVKTGSYLLDQIPHTRTFQQDEMTYQHIIQTCLESSGGEFIMREKQAETTKQLTVQYKESDYSFILRLAHRLGIVVLPEFKTKGKRLNLGLVQNIPATELMTDDYAMSRQGLDKDSLVWYERGVYHIKTRDIYELGQGVRFQRRKLFVSQIESYLQGSELMHQYTLCELKSAYERPQPHEKIRGISMRARITAVERDLVQVQIHEDENKDQSGHRWFKFATVYSTPDGTGWFVQPEKGDETRIIFPDSSEKGAYIASNVHLETSGGRVDPDHKSFKNKHNKEILLTPERLTLTTNNGLSIELEDSKGITMLSDRNIFIKADGQLHISSENAEVAVYGDRNITLQQGAAQIEMKDDIVISGGRIDMN